MNKQLITYGFLILFWLVLQGILASKYLKDKEAIPILFIGTIITVALGFLIAGLWW